MKSGTPTKTERQTKSSMLIALDSEGGVVAVAKDAARIVEPAGSMEVEVLSVLCSRGREAHEYDAESLEETGGHFLAPVAEEIFTALHHRDVAEEFAVIKDGDFDGLFIHSFDQEAIATEGKYLAKDNFLFFAEVFREAGLHFLAALCERLLHFVSPFGLRGYRDGDRLGLVTLNHSGNKPVNTETVTKLYTETVT